MIFKTHHLNTIQFFFNQNNLIGDQFPDLELDPTSHLEVVFEAPNLDAVIDDGRFSGTIRLIDDDGNTKAEDIQAVLNPDAWIDRTKDEWEMNYTRLHITNVLINMLFLRVLT